jgi:murein L,D-transpeptidase YcbB/YkuD
MKNRLKLISGLLISVIVISCNQPKKQSHASVSISQHIIDSTYIVKYMNAEPQFKDQLDWAKKFYRERKFRLGWFKNNKLVPQADKLLDIIKKSGEEGLNPKQYQIKDFDQMFADLKNSENDTAKFIALQRDIDLALTATYFVWATDYYRGLVIPKENQDIEWDVKGNKIKLHKALLTVLGDRKSKYPYADFKPLHEQYARLKDVLAKYRKIQASGGWPRIPENMKLKPEGKSPLIKILYKRLYGQDTADTSIVYDAKLVNAVKAFQSQNGLNPDGNIGSETVRLLNIPVEERIKTIILNMERWRWIPKSFEPDYLLVNIPEYKLYVFEKGQQKMSMNVIVGKVLNSAPIFSDRLEFVVLSPYWNVPVSILQKEIAPHVVNNPGYLDRLDMEVVTNNGERVSPSSINWSSISDDFNYVVRRRPGPRNDLGGVKFVFPNENNIYLHDTPHDELFSQAKRGFSHGCIRIEKPIDLAEYLLRNVPGYDRSTIINTINMRREKTVRLKQALPVYLVYFTSWVDANGNIYFYDDIYGHDKTLADKYFPRLR